MVSLRRFVQCGHGDIGLFGPLLAIMLLLLLLLLLLQRLLLWLRLWRWLLLLLLAPAPVFAFRKPLCLLGCSNQILESMLDNPILSLRSSV